MDYKEAYFKLYGELSDIIENLQKLQQEYEELYIKSKKDGEEK